MRSAATRFSAAVLSVLLAVPAWGRSVAHVRLGPVLPGIPTGAAGSAAGVLGVPAPSLSIGSLPGVRTLAPAGLPASLSASPAALPTGPVFGSPAVVPVRGVPAAVRPAPYRTSAAARPSSPAGGVVRRAAVRAASLGERFGRVSTRRGLGRSFSAGSRLFDGAEEPASVDGKAGAVPAKTLVLVQVGRDEDGRPRGTGLDEEDRLKEIAERFGDDAHLIGSRQIFQETFVVEVDRGRLAEFVEEVEKIDHVEAVPYDDLVSSFFAPSRRAIEPQSDAYLEAFESMLKDGSLTSRFSAANQLRRSLERVPPEQFSRRFSEDARNGLVDAVYGLAHPIVNLYNQVTEQRRYELRKARHEAAEAAGEKVGYGELEHHASRTLRDDPSLREDLDTLGGMFIRLIETIEALGTEKAEAFVLQMLPHVDSAGVRRLARNSALARHYVGGWLERARGEIDETVEGLRKGLGHDDGWGGSTHSGGYEHVEGDLNSMTLYEYAKHQFDSMFGNYTDEMEKLLGMMDGDDREIMIDGIVDLLRYGETKIPEIDRLNHDNTILKKLEDHESWMESEAKKWADNGRPIPEETLARFRDDELKRLEKDYLRHGTIHGHKRLDQIVQGLRYSPFMRYIPGFDEARYARAALDIFMRALDALKTPDMLRLVASAAIELTSSLYLDKRLLKDDPGVEDMFWRVIERIRAHADSGAIKPRSRLPVRPSS